MDMVSRMDTTDTVNRGIIAPAHMHAGFASRTLAFMLDLLVVAVMLLVAVLSLQLIGAFFPIGTLFAHLFGIDLAGQLRSLIALAVTIVVFVAYNTFWWTMIGETPGKAALRLRAVRTSGERLTVPRSIVRALAYWLSALPLFLGFVWIRVDDQRQGWHDKLADTCVIYAWQAHPATRTTHTDEQAAQAS